MIRRFSSLQTRKKGKSLGETFLVDRLRDAVAYDRIAGYFSLSILEVAGEAMAHIPKVRVVCNSQVSLNTVGTPEGVSWGLYKSQIWKEFAASGILEREVPKDLLELLYKYLDSGRLEVRILPEERFGLIHGKAGVLTLRDRAKTSFLGSANESAGGWRLNYELVWEDDSPEAIAWVQNEFDELWGDSAAIPLTREVIDEIQRLAKRSVIGLGEWKESPNSEPASAIIETPVYRKQNGLWAHQKYFVQKVFEDHKALGGARYVLADQVGLGKTLQLAMSAQLIALLGDKPILIIAPKTLLLQWQQELQDLLDVPSAVWDGKAWNDEKGVRYEDKTATAILRCPRKIGLISQGLISRNSETVAHLLKGNYDCVILDEAHRARRSKLPKIEDQEYGTPEDANNLYNFMLKIAKKTKTLLLATATPVQLHPVEAWDLLYILNQNHDGVLGNGYSSWMKPSEAVTYTLGENSFSGTLEEFWKWVRNPLPPSSEYSRENIEVFQILRDSLELADKEWIAKPEDLERLDPPAKDRLLELQESYFSYHNPFIRHIIQRTRAYLETTLDPDTNRPILDKVEVMLFGENEDQSLELGSYQADAYELARDYCRLLSKEKRGAGFLETLLLRRIGSSMVAGKRTAYKLLHGESEPETFEALFEDEEEELDFGTVAPPPVVGEKANILQRIINLLDSGNEEDPKAKKVFEILTKGVDGSEPWLHRGCIIFSSFYDTALSLAGDLSKKLPDLKIGLYAGSNRSAILLDGRLTRTDRNLVKKMVQNGEIKILIGTDAASEGLNLQTLGSLINFDLPWNPTKLEQRKGRIQRIGQKYGKIFLYNMRYRDSVEDNVHRKLSERLEAVMDLFGQIPDTLEDAWVEEALGREAEAEKLIRDRTEKHPFAIKYNKSAVVISKSWEKTFAVLNEYDRRESLEKGW